MDVNLDAVESFKTPDECCDWLAANHSEKQELWLKIFKKSSKIPSINWEEAVIEAIAWGWIDGIKKSCDKTAYFQRLTPRRKASGWSKRNCNHAENLMETGRMQGAGLKHVDAAKADGRWQAAYAGSAEMEIPEDFLKALAANKDAELFFGTLTRSNLFAIYLSLHTAKKPQTRQDRMDKILGMLARGEKFQ